MHVFVTGASGHIGFAVVSELLAAGHRVTGLARSEVSAAKLTAAGAGVLRGTLDDLDALGSAARSSDGVIHLAYKHELSRARRTASPRRRPTTCARFKPSAKRSPARANRSSRPRAPPCSLTPG